VKACQWPANQFSVGSVPLRTPGRGSHAWKDGRTDGRRKRVIYAAQIEGGWVSRMMTCMCLRPRRGPGV
jgi:hypothetical protein